mmetsp:Transcript_88752/g.253668  ORF Transcript_88752/g.253668 Transcript_88752/m.253668 type:complete len:82 (+) Transcript_88752:207-452(+)
MGNQPPALKKSNAFECTITAVPYKCDCLWGLSRKCWGNGIYQPRPEHGDKLPCSLEDLELIVKMMEPYTKGEGRKRLGCCS